MKKQEVIVVIEPKDIFTGDANAPVTITEFGDYESEECLKANDVVKELMELYPGKLKFIFRHFPLLQFHQKAHKAAEAAIAAGQEGKFWEMHQAIFANRRNIGVTSLKLYAREAGVVNKKFLDELINGTYGWYVHGDLVEGKELGVTTIPAFFINKKRFIQEPTLKNMKAHIESLLGSKKAKPALKPKAKAKAKSSAIPITVKRRA